MSTADPIRPQDTLPPPLVRAVGLLTCPVCGSAELTAPARRDRVAGLDCPAGHHWDAARQGVVNLLTGAGSRFTPDTPAMVEARDRFLRAGHYAPIADAVAAAVRSAVTTETPAVLDAGAGTGYYLDAVLAGFADGSSAPGHSTSDGPAAVATDLSPAALRRLARTVPTALPLVWDTWRPLPLRDGAVDVALAVFAPRNGPEFARVLAPGGVLVLVTPRPAHLARLRDVTGMLAVDPDKDDRLQQALADHFTVLARHDVDVPLGLTGAEAVDAAFMGPAGHHATAAELAARLGGVDAPLRVDAQVTVQVLRPRARAGDAG
ncbi:ubiquinone biosynthesis protein [Tersicoccus solisilvae]|uniref:Ubiquinone biosynthesis protein n=1 Tax=Tersicoccus solisilvae TaxID=1882339 RepID=A0ABQ1NRB9_9MICC|nr:SAM-dependent methyltransferase [Tersicoccus solisilvae]GGC83537.1 ubiquinone biosynthesis protein [Tersicoccus solisilvae]